MTSLDHFQSLVTRYLLPPTRHIHIDMVDHFQSLVTRYLLPPTRHIHTDMVANPRYAIKVEVRYLLIAQKQQQILGISRSLHDTPFIGYCWAKYAHRKSKRSAESVEAAGTIRHLRASSYIIICCFTSI